MRIGFDVDGVLADFNTSFIALVKKVTGRDLFPEGYWPDTWDYPQSLGYTEAEVSAVWDVIKKGNVFWGRLSALPDMDALFDWYDTHAFFDHEIYFITSRMGKQVKRQSETWLERKLFLLDTPTTLISSQKGEIAHALKLDYYIDDRAENILDVMSKSPQTFAYLIDQPWNQHKHVPLRIRTLADFLQVVDAHQAAAAA